MDKNKQTNTIIKLIQLTELKKISKLSEIKRKNGYEILIFSMIIFIIVFISFIISYYMSKHNYTPLIISEVDYENMSSIDKNKLIQNKESVKSALNMDINKETKNVFGLSSSDDLNDKNIQLCAINECVLDTETGLKKCPEHDNERLARDTKTEECTMGHLCTNDKLPYALNTDGSINHHGICDNNYNCPCVSDITCPIYVTSTLEILNGNAYNISTSDNNYFVVQNENKDYGFIAPVVDDKTKICRINPDFTDRIVHGNSFKYNEGDRFDCDNTWDMTNIDGIGWHDDPCAQNATLPTYKSMLTFIQADKNICARGQLSYNIDRILSDDFNNASNARHFCQSDIVGFDTYLSHPIYYTLSCTMGDGCDDILLGYEFADSNNDSLETYRDMVRERKEKYFPDYDTSGISNMLNLEVHFAKFDKQLNSKDMIFKIEPGDLLIPKDFTNTIGGNKKLQQTRFYIIKETGAETNQRIEDINYKTKLKFFEMVVPSNTEFNTFFIHELEERDIHELWSDIDIDDEIIKFNIYKPYGFNGLLYNTSSLIYYDIPSSTNPTGDNKLHLQGRVYDADSLYGLSSIPRFSGEPSLNDDPFLTIEPSTLIPTQIDEFSFKANRTMYYPVFNTNTFKQECIKCKPFLLAYCKLRMKDILSTTLGGKIKKKYVYDEKLDKIVIQYSSQDFGNYEKDFSRKWSTDSKLNLIPTKVKLTSRKQKIVNPFVYSESFDIHMGSTYKQLYVDSVKNAEIGDYIIIVKKNSVTPNMTWTWDTTTNNLVVKRVNVFSSNFFSFKSSNIQIEPMNGVTFSPNKNHNIKNLQMTNIPLPPPYDSEFEYKQSDYLEYGKMYKNDKDILGYINYTNCRITNVNAKLKNITTDVALTIPINDENHKLYIIKKDDILTLDLYVGGQLSDEGGQIAVEQISDKRIVNIKILVEGKKHIETNLPTIRIGQYYHHGDYSHSGFGEGHNVKVDEDGNVI